jgi:hypothetical protein
MTVAIVLPARRGRDRRVLGQDQGPGAGADAQGGLVATDAGGFPWDGRADANDDLPRGVGGRERV